MKVLIVGNGQPPSTDLIDKEAKQADLVIGADAGGNTLINAGVQPDIVMGDLDSFQKPENPNFRIIQNDDQETNDLEKALDFALTKEVIDCTVLGAFGNRMDHSLKNLSVLQAYNNRFRTLILRDDEQDVFMMRPFFSASYPVGTTVSLFPISGKVEGITTQGLAYPLNKETLENGHRDGSSNYTTEERISITYESGALVGLVSRKN